MPPSDSQSLQPPSNHLCHSALSVPRTNRSRRPVPHDDAAGRGRAAAEGSPSRSSRRRTTCATARCRCRARRRRGAVAPGRRRPIRTSARRRATPSRASRRRTTCATARCRCPERTGRDGRRPERRRVRSEGAAEGLPAAPPAVPPPVPHALSVPRAEDVDPVPPGDRVESGREHAAERLPADPRGDLRHIAADPVVHSARREGDVDGLLLQHGEAAKSTGRPRRRSAGERR